MSAYSPPTRRIPSCSSDYPQCEAKAHTLFPLPSHQIKTQNLSFLKRHRQIFSFRVLKRQFLLPFAQKQMKTLSVFAVALHPEGVDRNRMHFIVARLTQADEIVCVICKLRMFIRVLNVVHGRCLTSPPIPQAIPAQIAIPPQHRRSQPPPSRRVIIKAHDPPPNCCARSSWPPADTLPAAPSAAWCRAHTGKPQAYTNARPSSRMYPKRNRLGVGTGDMLFYSSLCFPPELLD